MADNARALIEDKIQQVRRRLRLRAFLHNLMVCWAGAMIVTGLLLLAKSFLPAALADLGPWLTGAIMLGVGTLSAILLACFYSPSWRLSALALDEEFHLKERVITAYTLSPEQLSSQPGQALLEDVHQHVVKLHVPSKFPIEIPRSSLLMPLGAALIAVACFFLEPLLTTRPAGANNNRVVVDAKEVQNALENLKKVSTVKKDDDEKTSEKLKELETEWDKLLKAPLDPKNQEQVRERANEIGKMEDKIKDRLGALKEMNQKGKDMKSALEKASLDKGKQAKDGPAKDLQDALAKGRLDKAQQALDQLSKKMANDKMTKEEKKELADQLQDLKERLKQLVDQKDKKEQLEKDFKDGKIDQNELKRQMDELAQNAEDLQDLGELADQLGECQECLNKGDNQKAGEKLRMAAERLKELGLSEAEMRRLLEQGDQFQEAREALLRACQGDGEGDGKGLGKGKGEGKKGNGMGSGRTPGTLRPKGEDVHDTKVTDTREKAEADPKGKQRIAGFVRGGSFSKIPAKEVEGTFKQTSQDAREAIERQLIPPEVADIARGYFQKLGGQK